MNITKSLILISLFTNSVNLFAQDTYFKIGTGYAFAMPGQKIDQSGNILNGSVSSYKGTSSYDIRSASFTSGVHCIIGGGIMLSKNIGIELNGDINLAPRKYTEKIYGLTASNGDTYDYTAERKGKNSIILEPSLLLKSGGGKLSLFMRIGPALPLNTGITLNETYAHQQTGNIDKPNWKIKNYFSVGFAAATGVCMKLSNKVSLYAEASMLYLSLSRKERDMESLTVNGINYPLAQFTGIKTYHYTKNGISDPTGHDQALPQPFSNLGITCGVFISLNGQTRKNKQAH